MTKPMMAWNPIVPRLAKHPKKVMELLDKWPDREKHLNMGSGTHRVGGWVNMDLNPPADVLWDALKTPWPFKDGEFGSVGAQMVLEHLNGDLNLVLGEVHRVLKPDGVLYVEVPHAKSIDATWGKLNHYRGFTENSFDCLDPEAPLYEEIDNTFHKTRGGFKLEWVFTQRRLRLGRFFDSWYHPIKYGFHFPNVGSKQYLHFLLRKT